MDVRIELQVNIFDFNRKKGMSELQKAVEYICARSESGGCVMFLSRQSKALLSPSFELIKPE